MYDRGRDGLEKFDLSSEFHSNSFDIVFDIEGIYPYLESFESSIARYVPPRSKLTAEQV